MKHKVIALISILMFVLLSACEAAKSEVGVPLPPTTAPVIAVTDAPATAALPSAEPATPLPPTEAPAVTPIVHVDVPGEPKYSPDQFIQDCNTGERVEMGVTTLVRSGCDAWKNSKLERPLTAANTNYLPAVDILTSSMGSNAKWIFGKIQLYKDAAGSIPADLLVGFEIDTDVDSRGEYLLLATGLNSTQWTVQGVQVWQDQTGDVGGEKPMAPDTKFGDGYETLVFDAGIGLDPDLAWARINPTDGAVIEFAFKPTILPQDQVFAWWAWSSISSIDPVKMEVVDTLQDTETWKVDNTCGWIFKSKPTKLLLNICEFFVPTATPVPTPTPSICQPVNCAPNQYSWNQPWWWDYATCTCKPTM